MKYNVLNAKKGRYFSVSILELAKKHHQRIQSFSTKVICMLISMPVTKEEKKLAC